MSIIKNKPLFEYKEGDWAKPRHIIIEGTDEEIGYDLGTLAKNDYGTELCPWVSPEYGTAKRKYLEKNFPSFAERSKGVRRAFGLPADDIQFDTSALPYDFYDVNAEAVDRDAFNATFCSGLVLPREKSEDGKGVFIGRNMDMFPTPLWTTFAGKPAPEGAFGYSQRSVVLEIRPETGYRSILMGGLDLMTPFSDGMNDQGLFYAIFADPGGVAKVAGPTAGERNNGVTMMQLGTFLLNCCATIEEAKETILTNRIIQVGLGIHMLLADKAGNATIFEIDKKSQAYVFTDRKPGEPLFVTNHPVFTYPTPDTFPKYDEANEHNTFNRMNMLQKAYSETKSPMTKSVANDLINLVHCAFLDDKLAQCAPKERTLFNTNFDLSKLEMSVRYYLGDVGPIKGTNHMEDRMSEPFTFGFD